MSCAKTAEAIEIPFGTLSGVDPKNHVGRLIREYILLLFVWSVGPFIITLV